MGASLEIGSMTRGRPSIGPLLVVALLFASAALGAVITVPQPTHRLAPGPGDRSYKGTVADLDVAPFRLGVIPTWTTGEAPLAWGTPDKPVVTTIWLPGEWGADTSRT